MSFWLVAPHHQQATRNLPALDGDVGFYLNDRLDHVHWLIATGIPVKTGEHVDMRTPVRVKSGRLQGGEGIAIQNEG